MFGKSIDTFHHFELDRRFLKYATILILINSTPRITSMLYNYTIGIFNHYVKPILYKDNHVLFKWTPKFNIDFGFGIIIHFNKCMMTDTSRINIDSVYNLCIPDVGEVFEIEKGVNLVRVDKNGTDFHFKIWSSTRSTSDLIKMIQSYDDEAKKKLQLPDNHLHYFEINSSVSSKGYLNFIKIPFTSTKKFVNVISPNTLSIKNNIDTFVNEKEKYNTLGIPYNHGMFFFGPPGTGKSSMIKAIANYTKRHIFYINLRHIEDAITLKKVFTQTQIALCENNELINLPIRNRLYVLEDIDCMTDLVKERRNNVNGGDSDSDEGSGDSDGGSVNNILGKLTLSDILNVLDGVSEASERMLIITTNKKNVLDKALIRPGRCDAIFNFTLCKVSHIMDIYSHFFKHDDDDDYYEETKRALVDDVLSPAQVVQICLNNLNDVCNCRLDLQEACIRLD